MMIYQEDMSGTIQHQQAMSNTGYQQEAMPDTYANAAIELLAQKSGLLA